MDICSLLNIQLDVIQDFPLQANRVADLQIERIISNNMKKLKKIEGIMVTEGNIKVSTQSIDKIMYKLIRLSKLNDDSEENWTMRELRIVSYYLMKLRSDSEAYHFAISLLDKYWKNLYFNGLVFYLMNSWHSIEPKYREITSKLLVNKLQEYSDNNKRYIQLKNHANLFEPVGPKRMAAIVLQKGMNLMDAPTLLGYRSSSIKASYYSDVIIQFFKEKRTNDFSVIEKVFDLHPYDRTKKLLLANLVEYENNHTDGFRRAKLCNFINHILGDVSLASTWAPFIGATDEEAQQLRQAMKHVNIWFAQQIIETFFEICVQDKARKEFWLNYVNYIDGFKIVGSSVIRSSLKADSKIGGLFLKHFIETNSRTSQTSALVLFIKNKMLVEFSDTGALYAYNKGHQKVHLVTRRQQAIESTADLKIPSMNMLVESEYWYYDEGRLTHQGHWQIRLKNWLKEKVLSETNSYTSFFSEEEDNVFKAIPLPKEETIERDYLQKNDLKEHSSFFKQETSLPTTDNKYELKTGILYSKSSKWIYENYKIVANNDGFYAYSMGTNKFAFLTKNEINKFIEKGNIWIKPAKLEGWSKIIFFLANAETCIGYIRSIEHGIIFKEDLNSSERRKIKFE